MPNTNDILDGLNAIAHGGILFAVGWHVVLTAALIALASGWRPQKRIASVLLAAPLASVSAFAFLTANVFNGAVFALLAAAVVVLVLARNDADPVHAGTRWTSGVAMALLAYAWAYPHFLADQAPAFYLIASPLGLLPCPTLALVTAFLLLGNGFDHRPLSLAVAAAGGFYAIVGVARLHVALDAGLLVGAVALFFAALPRTMSHAAPRLRHA